MSTKDWPTVVLSGDRAIKVGGVMSGGITVIVTVADAPIIVPSFAEKVKTSTPLNPAFGV
jgi:hypothetical protein